MIIPIVIALLIIAAVIWYGYYWREEHWRNLSFRRQCTILIKNGSNVIGKRVIDMTDDSIRIQHYGWYLKSDYLKHLVKDGGFIYFEVR